MTPDPTAVEFGTTRWSLVAELGAGDPAIRAVALERLASIYWPAVCGFLQHQGVSAEQAEELTQAFFTEVVLGRELLNKAEPQKGRLRSLILTALKRFRIDRARRTDAADRALAGRGELASAADSPADSECIGETVFNRLWAAAQIGETLRRCEEHFNRTERSHYWSLFDERVIRPNVGHTEPSPLNTTFARLGFESPAAAAAALQVVKRRFQTVLREVVSEANLDDPDAECDLLSRLA